MPRIEPIPIALTIAGSDSGGGAGIQADLKTFAALGVHGTTALTALTAQNPTGVRSVHAVPARFLREQIEATMDELPPSAIKTGMLFSSALIRTVASCLMARGPIPLVVDPVMVATSGAQLLKPNAVRALQDRFLPLATVITPNLDEAALLLGRRLHSEEDLRAAARDLRARFGCAALVKGGHLRGARQAVDIFYDGETELLLQAPFIRDAATHGTGCTYSAAIAAYLAHGFPLDDSVAAAKEFITQAIAQRHRVGRHEALNSLWTPCPPC
jgi:hydroxymethylpyrimidine/phosphomethylpyrimidine kinase